MIGADSTRGNGILTLFPKGVHIPILDYTVQPPPETQYDIIVVASEYDGFADFPDRPWNLIAVANAIIGIAVVHVATADADLSKVPDENITTTINSKGGVTTSYLIPTEHLPLLQPLRIAGVPEPQLAAVEEPLKWVVDTGYSRNDRVAVQPAPTQLARATDPVNAFAMQSETPLVQTSSPPSEQNVTSPNNNPDPRPAPQPEVVATSEPGNSSNTFKPTLISDGNKVSPSTAAGTTQSSSGWKPADGIKAAAGEIHGLFSGNNASTSTTTGTPTSGTSTTTGTETPSSTSSSPDSGTRGDSGGFRRPLDRPGSRAFG